MVPRTPSEPIEAHVGAFCRSLSDDVDPVFVPVDTRHVSKPVSADGAVREHAARLGGQLVVGWAVLEWPRVVIEAEPHTVWRSPTGELVDLSPCTASATRTLFVAGADQTHEPSENVRGALADDPLVHAWLAAIAHERSAFASLLRAHATRAARFTVDEAHGLGQATYARRVAQVRVYAKFGEASDPCVCGSGRTFERCCHAHGPDRRSDEFVSYVLGSAARQRAASLGRR